MTVELLLFDLGGVLVDYVGFSEIGALISEAVTPEELQERWRACGAEGFETGRITPAEFATALGSVLAFNVLLFLAAMSVLGVEAALYSILTYVTAARTLDYVIYGLEEYTAITIVSRQSDTIREAITGELARGVTVYKGYGGMTGEEQKILYCVVTRLEIGKVKAIVRALDASAFVVYHPLANAEGGVVKKTGLH